MWQVMISCFYREHFELNMQTLKKKMKHLETQIFTLTIILEFEIKLFSFYQATQKMY